VRIVTVEPEGAPTLARALEAGEPVTLPRASSVADGLIPVRIGVLPFAHLAHRVDRAVLVPDGAIRRAVRFALERLKLVLEPSGAATLAWLLECPPDAVEGGGPVVAVASGGNVEWLELCAVLAADEAAGSGGAAGAGHSGGEPA
jgi:threonine dehydratase